MNFMFKAGVAILVLACTISQSAVAGTFEDGSNAWDRGDYVSAMHLLRPLADRGDPKAQNRVGMMYQRGWGVSLNYADAVSWLRQAADQGDADAQNNLAFMYLYGRGVSQDYVSAHMWFSLAASGGVRAAGFFRDLLAAKMTPFQVAKAQKLAHEWKPADDRRHFFQLNAESIPISRTDRRAHCDRAREPAAVDACGRDRSSTEANRQPARRELQGNAAERGLRPALAAVRSRVHPEQSGVHKRWGIAHAGGWRLGPRRHHLAIGVASRIVHAERMGARSSARRFFAAPRDHGEPLRPSPRPNATAVSGERGVATAVQQTESNREPVHERRS